jgi:hypothetical protein
MDAALGPDILAEDENPRVDLQLMLQRAADGGDHVDALAVGLGLLVAAGRPIALRPLAAELLHLAFIIDIGENGFGIGDAAGFRFDPGRLDGGLSLRLDARPILLAQQRTDQERLELGQRIAQPFLAHQLVALVGLGVLEAVALEARYEQVKQGRPLAHPDMLCRRLDQAGGFGGIGAVALKMARPVKLARLAEMSAPGV